MPAHVNSSGRGARTVCQPVAVRNREPRAAGRRSSSRKPRSFVRVHRPTAHGSTDTLRAANHADIGERGRHRQLLRGCRPLIQPENPSRMPEVAVGRRDAFDAAVPTHPRRSRTDQRNPSVRAARRAQPHRQSGQRRARGDAGDENETHGPEELMGKRRVCARLCARAGPDANKANPANAKSLIGRTRDPRCRADPAPAALPA